MGHGDLGAWQPQELHRSQHYLAHLSYPVRHKFHADTYYEAGIGWSFPYRLDEASWYANRPSSFPGTTGRDRYR